MQNTSSLNNSVQPKATDSKAFDEKPALLDDDTYSRFILPEDDGKPLSEEEKKAFLSTGDFDKELTYEQATNVLRHFKQLVHNEQKTIIESISRAQWYLPSIRSILAENKLPSELAYLPFVESNYNVFAHSKGGALGLWQFIPSSASYYGLKRDLWTDERRDPIISTRIAAVYLSRLRDIFDGKWDLALSAYNAGEGKIKRSLEATGAKNFFELRKLSTNISDTRLRMTQENSQYFPKFLAVCKIMRNLSILGFTPEQKSIDLCKVIIKPGTNLTELARQTGMDWDTFLRHNAYFLRRFSHPAQENIAYVPITHFQKVHTWLKKHRGTKAYSKWRPYTVCYNDTCRSIAARSGITSQTLWNVNQLDGEDFRRGAVILVPPGKMRTLSTKTTMNYVAAAKQERLKKGQYAVRYGDTLRSISKKFGLTINELLLANGMQPQTARIHCGDVLNVKKGQYLVQEGDSMWSIAKKFGLSLDDLLLSNGMNKKSACVKRGDLINIQVSKAKPSRQIITIVPTGCYRVCSGDSIWGIARKFGVSVKDLLALNNMTQEKCTLREGDIIRVSG